MIRRIAILLVLALALSSARTLLCQFDCDGAGHTEQAVACHEEDPAASRVVASQVCDHASDTVLFVVGKTQSLAQPRFEWSVAAVVPARPFMTTGFVSQTFAGPPGHYPPLQLSTRTVLRI